SRPVRRIPAGRRRPRHVAEAGRAVRRFIGGAALLGLPPASRADEPRPAADGEQLYECHGEVLPRPPGLPESGEAGLVVHAPGRLLDLPRERPSLDLSEAPSPLLRPTSSAVALG